VRAISKASRATRFDPLRVITRMATVMSSFGRNSGPPATTVPEPSLPSDRHARDLEGFARDPVRSLAGDHAHGDGDVVVRAEFGPARDHRSRTEHPFGDFAQKDEIGRAHV